MSHTEKKKSRTLVNYRVDTELKISVEELFADLGVTTSDAIEIFFRQCVAKGGLPFEVQMTKEERERLKRRFEGAQLRNESRRATLAKKNKDKE